MKDEAYIYLERITLSLERLVELVDNAIQAEQAEKQATSEMEAESEFAQTGLFACGLCGMSWRTDQEPELCPKCLKDSHITREA